MEKGCKEFDLVVCSVFFNDTATTEIYTLSLHDALPICLPRWRCSGCSVGPARPRRRWWPGRSEEHTSELQSRVDISYAVFCLTKTLLWNMAASAFKTVASSERVFRRVKADFLNNVFNMPGTNFFF